MSVIRDDTAGQGTHDRNRYQDKIRERLKKALPDIVGQAPIITGRPTDHLTIPVSDGDLHLPKYRPAEPTEPQPGVGQGEGHVGDVVGAIPRPGDGQTGGAGSQAGDAEAAHHVLIDLSIEELRALILEDLHLPPLPPKRPAALAEPDIRWTSRSRHGARSQVDARTSLKQALLRSQAQHEPLGFQPEDLRYRTWIEQSREVTQAVIYLLRDTSGSMNAERRYLSQAAALYLVLSLRQQYERCPIHFWVHDIQGRETEEMPFYHLDSAGGTRFTPVYAALREDMDIHYPVTQWNRMVIQFSDGDCWDAEEAKTLLRDWLPTLHFFGLILTAPTPQAYPTDSLRKWGNTLGDPFAFVHLRQRGDVLEALRRLMTGGDRDAP